jgi:hypothetical protein
MDFPIIFTPFSCDPLDEKVTHKTRDMSYMQSPIIPNHPTILLVSIFVRMKFLGKIGLDRVQSVRFAVIRGRMRRRRMHVWGWMDRALLPSITIHHHHHHHHLLSTDDRKNTQTTWYLSIWACAPPDAVQQVIEVTNVGTDGMRGRKE